MFFFSFLQKLFVLFDQYGVEIFFFLTKKIQPKQKFDVFFCVACFTKRKHCSVKNVTVVVENKQHTYFVFFRVFFDFSVLDSTQHMGTQCVALCVLDRNSGQVAIRCYSRTHKIVTKLRWNNLAKVRASRGGRS